MSPGGFTIIFLMCWAMRGCYYWSRWTGPCATLWLLGFGVLGESWHLNFSCITIRCGPFRGVWDNIIKGFIFRCTFLGLHRCKSFLCCLHKHFCANSLRLIRMFLLQNRGIWPIINITTNTTTSIADTYNWSFKRLTSNRTLNRLGSWFRLKQLFLKFLCPVIQSFHLAPRLHFAWWRRGLTRSQDDLFIRS